jgi:hypothetical protein
MSHKRGSQFRNEWLLKYGLAITTRDPKTSDILSIKCKFCELGKDSSENENDRKRKRTERVKYYQKPWRKDNIERHLKEQHSKRYHEYSNLTTDDKIKFFEQVEDAKPFAAFLNPDAGQAGRKAKRQILIDISKDVVDVIINQLLTDYYADEGGADDHDGAEAETTYSEIFNFVSNEESEYYQASWSNALQFEMIVSCVGIGTSFKQCEKYLLNTKEKCGLGALGNVSMGKVIQVVRYTCALNYEIMREILANIWAFSIAVDGGTKASVPYLDVRMRVVVRRKLFNIHLVALPMYERHTGENMFILLEKFLNALCSGWKQKLISVSTDGASNMTGSQQGLVTRIDRECLPGFYRIWCGAHQLDLVVQSIFVQLLDDRFVQNIHNVTGHLRRQQNLIREMGTKCPKFVDTRWLSMERLLAWLVKHRLRVVSHLESKQRNPSKAWWVMVYLVKDFTEIVNVTFRALQGKTTLVQEQGNMLERLANQLRNEGEVKGPIMSIAPMESDETTYVKAPYFAGTHEAELHIRGRKSFVREIADELKNNVATIDDYRNIIRSICVMYVDGVSGITKICAERDKHNRGTTTLPPVLPKSLLFFSKQQFGDLIAVQKMRLLSFVPEQEINELEEEFSQFKMQTQLEEGFRHMVERMDDGITFNDAWGSMGLKYPRLCWFFGGLATAFPGTSTVESDFSIIGFEKSDYRTSLTNFSLEGILQCKQFEELQRIQSLLKQ